MAEDWIEQAAREIAVVFSDTPKISVMWIAPLIRRHCGVRMTLEDLHKLFLEYDCEQGCFPESEYQGRHVYEWLRQKLEGVESSDKDYEAWDVAVRSGRGW